MPSIIASCAGSRCISPACGGKKCASSANASAFAPGRPSTPRTATNTPSNPLRRSRSAPAGRRARCGATPTAISRCRHSCRKRAGAAPERVEAGDSSHRGGGFEPMSDKHNVLAICGSLRRGSYNAMLARNLPALAPAEMTIVPSPPIGTMPLYNFDVQSEQGFPAPVTALGDAIRAASGIMFVTPEYNYSIPGVLKNAIDWVSRLPNQPLAGKPVAIQSASPSVLGGARAQYHLRQMMVFLDEPTRKIIAQQLAAFSKFIARVGVPA